MCAATVCAVAVAAAEAAVAGAVTGGALDGGAWLRRLDATETAALLWQAAVVTVVAFVRWYMGVQRTGTERATLFTGLIPLTAVCTAPLLGTGSDGPARPGPGRRRHPGGHRGRPGLRPAPTRRSAVCQRLPSRMTRATSAGSSFIGQCPQPGSRTSRALGMICLARTP